MSRLLLDAGAFIAFEKGDAGVRARLMAARRIGLDVVTTSPVVGQVWRDGRRQALLARVVAATDVQAPDVVAARRAGELMAKTGGNDVVDALLAVLAGDGDAVVTSDPADLRALIAAAGTSVTVIPV
jgi:predicted nucleic acid-binding protein